MPSVSPEVSSTPRPIVSRAEASVAELVEAAQDGDRAAYGELARRYRPAIAAIAFARTGCRDEADDLAQEVLTRAWCSLDALREPARFGGWLRGIAENACRDWYRRSRPWPVSLDETPEARQVPDEAPLPLEVLLRRERERAWRQLITVLPIDNQRALLMHLFGGCSYERIAEVLEVPVTTVEGRIYRAKAQLRRLAGAHAADLLGDARRTWSTEGK